MYNNICDNKGRKKEYVITSLGKENAERELERLVDLTKTASKIIGGKYNE